MPGNLFQDLGQWIKDIFGSKPGTDQAQDISSPANQLANHGSVSPQAELGNGMRVNFERTGGFAGMRLAVEVMTSSLPQEEAAKLVTLVESSHFFDLPPTLQAQPGMSDSFQYKLTVEKGELFHTVVTSDSALPEELQPLIAHLTDVARANRVP